MNDHDPVDLSPELRRALDAAPTTAVPSRGLEGRMVRALRRRGLIVPERWAATRHPLWASTLRVAASLVIFGGGVTFGHWLGGRAASANVTPAAARTTWELAAAAQHTGSMNAAALGDLVARVASAPPADVELARQVALASLRATLAQLELLDLSDPMPIRFLSELQAREAQGTLPLRTGDGQWVVSF